MQCPICKSDSPVELEPDGDRDQVFALQASRTMHLVDHALHATLGVRVDEVGEIDVAEFVTRGTTWTCAASSAREFIVSGFGEWLSDMQRVAAQLPMQRIGEPPTDRCIHRIEIEDVGAAMLAWLDQHPIPAEV